jgi:hypothetical protein
MQNTPWTCEKAKNKNHSEAALWDPRPLAIRDMWHFKELNLFYVVLHFQNIYNSLHAVLRDHQPFAL